MLELEENLEWLAERYAVGISRRATGRWDVDLGNPEFSDASFDGADLGQLIAVARAWAEAPESERLPGRDWQRLCEAAARLGKTPRALLHQGARELLDRISAEAGGAGAPLHRP